jgi:hypothetical protein
VRKIDDPKASRIVTGQHTFEMFRVAFHLKCLIRSNALAAGQLARR